MKRASQSVRIPQQHEEGYMLVAVIFMLAIVLLTLAVAVPKVRQDLQRQRDLETMHRGQQYIRAIQLYYRKFGSYPPSIDVLVKTNEIRFLRKRYIDPTTGKDDWKPVAVGQNNTPIMGFFGQPLAGAGSPIGGTGPGGVTGATPASSAFGSTDSSGSAFGSNSPTPNSPTASSPTGGSSGFSLGSGIGSSGSSPSGTSSFGSGGIGSTTPGTPGGTTGTGSPTDAGGSAFGGQTFGGAGLMGVSPASPKQSIYVYKKKNHYNEWEFLYSPQLDQMMQAGGAGAIGQPAGSLSSGSSGIGQGTGTGLSGGSQSGGFSLGSGVGGSSPTSPTSPPQAPSPTP